MHRRNWLLSLGVFAMLPFIAFGCESREVDTEKAFDTEPRNNQSGAPATGVEQNPGRPQSNRPESNP